MNMNMHLIFEEKKVQSEWTDLSENTETIADLFSTSSPNIGDIAGHLCGEHSTHGVTK